MDLVDTVFVMLGNRNRWDIVDSMHDEFKEWQDPGSSRKPIPVESILAAVGKSASEIDAISKDATYYQRLDAALGK